MGLFFKKKKKVEIIEEKSIATPKDKRTAQINCMIVRSFVNDKGITEYTAKFSIGDRKIMFNGAVDARKLSDPMDVGDVFVAMYDPNNPEDAIIRDFEEL